MLLLLTCSPAAWFRLAAALEAEGSHGLAGIVRDGLAAPGVAAAESVSLAFTPSHAGQLQRTGAGLGISLPATPVIPEPDVDGWAVPAAERAAAVAEAEAIIRAHQRRVA